MPKTPKPPRPPKYRLGDRLDDPLSGTNPLWEKDGDTIDLQTAISRLRVLLGKEAVIKEAYTKETVLPLLALDGVDHSSELSQFWARKAAYITSLDPTRAIHRTFNGTFYMIKLKVVS